MVVRGSSANTKQCNVSKVYVDFNFKVSWKKYKNVKDVKMLSHHVCSLPREINPHYYYVNDYGKSKTGDFLPVKLWVKKDKTVMKLPFSTALTAVLVKERLQKICISETWHNSCSPFFCFLRCFSTIKAKTAPVTRAASMPSTIPTI